MQKQLTIGAFEYISFPEFGGRRVLAKVDTGAYSGALHCTDIKVVRRGLERKRILKFTPFGDKSLATETEDFTSDRVRSSNGHQQKRYFIKTTLEFQNKTYTLQISLSDRSKMTYEMLLGRQFLRQNNMLVDTRINQELDNDLSENGV